MARIATAFFDTPMLLRVVTGPADPSWKVDFATGILNLYELVHGVVLRGQDAAAGRIYDRMAPASQALTRGRILEACRLRVRLKDRNLSYADAAGYVTAREMGAVFWTTDRGFHGLPGVRIVSRDDVGPG